MTSSGHKGSSRQVGQLTNVAERIGSKLLVNSEPQKSRGFASVKKLSKKSKESHTTRNQEDRMKLWMLAGACVGAVIGFLTSNWVWF